MSLATRLQELLNAAQIDDDEIRSGIRLSDVGIAKLASRLGVPDETVRSTMHELIERLRTEHNSDVSDDSVYGVVYEAAQGERYAYECDFLGNMTVRDSLTGDEHYVAGSDSAHIIRELENLKGGSPEEQRILASLCGAPNQSLTEDDHVHDDGDLLSEIKNDAGSYNFPWRVGDMHGTGTAAYKATETKFTLKLISIRDDRGEEISANDKLSDEITKQARDFIGQE